MITHTYTLQFYIKANRGENCTGRCRHSSMEDKTALACTIRFLFLYPSCSKWQRAHKHTHLHTRTVAFRPNNRPRIETRVWQHWRTETLQNTWSQTTYDFSLFSGSFNLLLWWKNISGRESLKNVHRKGFDGQERLNNTNVEKRNVKKKKKKKLKSRSELADRVSTDLPFNLLLMWKSTLSGAAVSAVPVFVCVFPINSRGFWWMYGLMFGQTEFDRCVWTPQEGRGGQRGGRGT